MKLDLSGLPKKFVRSLDNIVIERKFTIPVEKTNEDTEDMIAGPVSLYKHSNGYIVCYGATRLTTAGEFKLEPMDSAEYDLFVSETTFNSIEDAWNTFHDNYGGA